MKALQRLFVGDLRMFEIESQELDYTVVKVKYKNEYYRAFIDNEDMDLTQVLRINRTRMKSGSFCYYLSVSKNGRNTRNSDHRFLHHFRQRLQARPCNSAQCCIQILPCLHSQDILSHQLFLDHKSAIRQAQPHQFLP